MRKEWTFPSSNGKNKIHVVEWAPSREPRAVLQICHGMTEHILRYEPFALFLNEYNILVVGHDHLGHGKSVLDSSELGHFEEFSGNKYLISDIHRLRTIMQEKYKDLPYFMMGHSMGSFLLRQYLTMRADGLAGAIIMGTGFLPGPLLTAGQAVCHLIALTKGWSYHSRLVETIGMGGYNKQFAPTRTDFDWLSSVESNCDAYIEDPLCGFKFTLGGYHQMFQGMKSLTKKDALKNVPRNLPILFVSGDKDPVGSNGEGVKKVYEKYKAAGFTNIKMKLYKNDRHEILNEANYVEVYRDLAKWMGTGSNCPTS